VSLQRHILGTDPSYIQPSAIFAGPCPSSAARLRAHLRTAGDFIATASLIDVFITLLGILTASHAPFSTSKLPATPTQLHVQRSNNNSARTPAAASRKSDD
jgi:hypothetical protein